jgi:hypothetical protein
MSATILPFPSLNGFNHRDIIELSRWSVAAAQHRWFVKSRAGGDRRESWIATGHDGAEYVALAYGHPAGPSDFVVQPRRGRWEVQDYVDRAMEGTFRSLREALETVCPTLG